MAKNRKQATNKKTTKKSEIEGKSKTTKKANIPYHIETNFCGYQFSRVLIFTDTDFRELAKFAKISTQEISEIQKFAKISIREK